MTTHQFVGTGALPQGWLAIDTYYAGCHFRSRLEARWAVLLDHLGVSWLYEPQGFDMHGVKYLPDFYLPQRQIWLEIKGAVRISEWDIDKVTEFSRQAPMVILSDIPTEPFCGRHVKEGNWRHLALTGQAPVESPSDEMYLRTFCWMRAPVTSTALAHWQAAINAARSARFEFGQNG